MVKLAVKPLQRIVSLARRPLERFLRIQASSGILLLAVTAVALGLANSPWAETYFAFWHQSLDVSFGQYAFRRSVEWWVNDVLMVVFFFVVGMEIRREIYQGELSDLRRAALPAAAALGGMLAPALCYLALAGAPETHSGWGVPMATDIAFAIGILTLLGNRVPPALRVLLLALAVIDDLGAILVIALFYSSGVVWTGLVVAAAGVLGIVAFKRFGVTSPLAYLPPGLVVWAGIYSAGVHPTIAGVVVGLMTPVADREAGQPSVAHELIEHLHPWVAYAIMPIFALANAGVVLGGGGVVTGATEVFAGSAIGLVLGKPLGILGAIWITMKLKISTLPRGIGRRHLLVLGIVAGIGFTMSLFVAQLAFTDAALLAAAKRGVLVASAISAVLAVGLGRLLLREGLVKGAATSADEAEASTDL